MAEKFAGDRLAVLTINSDHSLRTINKTLDKVKTTLPVLRDVEYDVFEAYRAQAIPTLYLIDQQGKVYSTWTGYVEDLETELTDNIGFMQENYDASLLAEPVNPTSPG